MSRILVPGRTCGDTFTTEHAGVLVDGEDYYRAVYRALCHASYHVLIAGWQLDTDVPLLRGADAEGAPYPVELLPLLNALCDERPELHVYVLAWDHSLLLLLERQPLQELAFRRQNRDQIHVNYDDFHPIGASHHQKVVVVDRAIAFVGGMDLCKSRWDTREHRATDDRRAGRFGRGYAPYHDVQGFVTGDAVDCLIEYFEHRWTRSKHGGELVVPEVPRTTIAIEPTAEVVAPTIGVTRTIPRIPGELEDGIEELRELHVAAIAAARRLIYLENQYYTSDDVTAALIARMRLAARAGEPLEIVIVLPVHATALKERIALGLRQSFLLRQLVDEAARTGNRLGVYYSAASGDDGDVPIYIHAKILVVDDRFLLVSSANTINRSMGLDSELGLAWEADAPTDAIRDARAELLAHLAGASREDVLTVDGLVARLDALADAGRGRLRRHPMDEQDGLLGKLLPGDLALDPDAPIFDDALARVTEGDGPVLGRLRRAWRALRRGLDGSRGRTVGGTSLAAQEPHDVGRR